MDQKAMVRRFINEAVNGGDDDSVEDFLHAGNGGVGARLVWRVPHILSGHVYFFRFSGDRIAGAWGIEDTLDRFQQLGLDPNRP